MATTNQNSTLPDNTYIHVSKFRVYIRILIGILILAGVIFIYFNGPADVAISLRKEKFALYIGPVAALFLFYQAFTALKKTGAQLTLNDKGIIIAEKELMRWDDISEIKITWNASKLLTFKHRDEKVKVNFETYNIKPFVLKDLVDAYRAKHLQNAQRNAV